MAADYYFEVSHSGDTPGPFVAISNPSGVLAPTAYWHSLRLASSGSASFRFSARRYTEQASGGTVQSLLKLLQAATDSVCVIRRGNVTWPSSNPSDPMTFVMDTNTNSERRVVTEFPLSISPGSALVLSLVDAVPGQTLVLGVCFSV